MLHAVFSEFDSSSVASLVGPNLVGPDLVGLGATAALVSDRPRRGEHRFHIAFANAAGIAHCTCVMAKGRRDRAAEEDLVSRAIVLSLARACGVAAPSPRSLLDADEHFEETVVSTADIIGQLVAGELDRITAQIDGQLMLSAPAPLLLLPGSFNPLHSGHVLLAVIGRGGTDPGQVVLQGQNDEVAWLHPQRGRFCAFFIDVTVASGSVALPGVARGEFHFQYTVVAAQIHRLGDQTAFRRAWTRFCLDQCI